MANWIMERVSKIFGDTRAVDKFTLEIEENKIYGLIGRNGAGKTTLLKLLAAQLQPTDGHIRRGSESLRNNDKLSQEICLAREAINLNGINNFSAEKIFSFAAGMYPEWDHEYCQELISRFDLSTKKKYAKLSKGMHTVIGIIVGLSSRAPLTLFDEPYVGLDPVGREIFYESLIEDYEEHKRTVVISSHLINELENLFERVLIIHQGSLVLNEDMEKIQRKAKIISGDRERVESALKGKRVIYKKVIGRLANYTVLDDFTAGELQEFKTFNISCSSVDLQKLFVNISKGGLLNEHQ